MKNQFSLVLTAVILLGSASLLTGCNTTAGAGRDISATGDALTSSAKKNTP
jgi:predicted small secreted protein